MTINFKTVLCILTLSVAALHAQASTSESKAQKLAALDSSCKQTAAHYQGGAGPSSLESICRQLGEKISTRAIISKSVIASAKEANDMAPAAGGASMAPTNASFSNLLSQCYSAGSKVAYKTKENGKIEPFYDLSARKTAFSKDARAICDGYKQLGAQ